MRLNAIIVSNKAIILKIVPSQKRHKTSINFSNLYISD